MPFSDSKILNSVLSVSEEYTTKDFDMVNNFINRYLTINNLNLNKEEKIYEMIYGIIKNDINDFIEFVVERYILNIDDYEYKEETFNKFDLYLSYVMDILEDISKKDSKLKESILLYNEDNLIRELLIKVTPENRTKKKVIRSLESISDKYDLRYEEISNIKNRKRFNIKMWKV